MLKQQLAKIAEKESDDNKKQMFIEAIQSLEEAREKAAAIKALVPNDRNDVWMDLRVLIERIGR